MVEVREANLFSDRDAEAIVAVLDAYASDPIIAGSPLSETVKTELVDRMCRLAHCQVFLAEEDEQVVGVAICFVGFSTFRAREVVNIHDLAVLPEFRNRGVGSAMLNAVEDFSRSINACKITLEVRESNRGAERLYQRKGFRNPNGDGDRSVFLERHLAETQSYI